MSNANNIESGPVTFGRFSLRFQLKGRDDLNDGDLSTTYFDYQSMVEDFNRLLPRNPNLNMSIQEVNDLSIDDHNSDKLDYSKLQAYMEMVKAYILENKMNAISNLVKH